MKTRITFCCIVIGLCLVHLSNGQSSKNYQTYEASQGANITNNFAKTMQLQLNIGAYETSNYSVVDQLVGNGF